MDHLLFHTYIQTVRTFARRLFVGGVLTDQNILKHNDPVYSFVFLEFYGSNIETMSRLCAGKSFSNLELQ